MKTLQSKISRFTLAMILVLSLAGVDNNMKAQFSSGTFVITNNSSCDVYVFFEFNNCAGLFYCCNPAFVVNVTAGNSVNVTVTPGHDALMRVFPHGWPNLPYIGDFATDPTSVCVPNTVPPGTSVSGNDCHGTPGALTAEVNGTCGTDCMLIW